MNAAIRATYCIVIAFVLLCAPGPAVAGWGVDVFRRLWNKLRFTSRGVRLLG